MVCPTPAARERTRPSNGARAPGPFEIALRAQETLPSTLQLTLRKLYLRQTQHEITGFLVVAQGIPIDFGLLGTHLLHLQIELRLSQLGFGTRQRLFEIHRVEF